ncbi:MAG: PorP/SprF family type IX secretion system membrane protein, partial [Bacteroidetes bacterium]|nr:PorP/SprF family type IX secretion system membrane protein [Bacteroidota bacterium]
VGFSAGLVQLALDGSQLTAPDGEYLPGTVIHNDNFLPSSKVSSLAPCFSFGLIYGFSNFSLGIAMEELNKPKLNLSQDQSGTIIFLNRTINIHSSYVIETEKLRIIPSVFVKTDFIKWQAQTEVMIKWKKILAGLGFRGYSGLNNDALIGVFGFSLKEKVQVAYSYDYNLSYLNNSNSGSHEISLKLELPRSFKQNVKTNMMYNPRFL